MCEFDHITAGEWLPEIISANGKVPIDLGVSSYTKSLVISNVSPSTGLNVEGDNVLTITG